MPSSSDDHSASPSQDPPAPEETEAEPTTASGPEGPDEPAPTTCPNCGHDFTGNYCPNCGQEAGRSVTLDDVAGTFAREMADVEGGLWATFKGLTLRPGDTLRAYLGGARAQFISPGRYLLVSILLTVGVSKGLMWIGALEDIDDFYAESTGGMDVPTTTQVFMDTVAQASQSQWWNTAIVLASVGLLALIFRRIFREEMDDWAVALAASAFLNGHAMILWNAVVLLHAAVVFAWTGQPLSLTSVSVYPVLIVAFYVGAATYRFVPGWRNAVKGGLGAFWVNAEAIGIGSLLIVGYLLVLVRPPSTLSPEGGAFLSVMSGVYATPILLHAAAEGYYRLR
jgi:hypothetical protein